MIKVKLPNKLITEYFLHKNHRLLTVQHNVNKCGVSHYSINYQRNNESNSSCLSLSKQLLQNNLYPSSVVPSFMNIQRRHLSDHDLIKNLPPPLETIEPPSSPPYTTSNLLGEMVEDNFMFSLPKFLVNTSQEKPVQIVQDLIIQFHQEIGMPWWSTIVLTAVLVKLSVILPFYISQLRNKNLSQALKNHLVRYKIKLKKETKEFSTNYGWPEEMFSEKFQKLIKKEEERMSRKLKCHPKKHQVATSIRFSAWILFSLAIRNLCNAFPPSDNAEEIYKEMTTGGFSWITDLTQPDLSLTFPFIYIMLNLAIIESQKLFLVNPNDTNEQFKYLLCHLLNIFMVPIAISSPSAVNLYWVSCNTILLMEIYLLHSPIAQKLLRMPPLDVIDSHEFYYKQLKARLRSKPKAVAAPKALPPSKQIE